MTRTHRRISRALIAGLGITLSLALVFWLINLSRSRPQQANAQNKTPAVAAAPAVPVSPAVLGKPDEKPASNNPPAAEAVLETPTTRPAAQLLSATGTVSTTQPAGNSPAGNAAIPAAYTSGNSLADAKAQAAALCSGVDIGQNEAKLLAVRQTLCDALIAGNLPDAEAKSVKEQLNQINNIVIFSDQWIEIDGFGEMIKIPPGGALSKIARNHDVTAELLMRINGITDPKRLQAGKVLKVPKGPFNAIVSKKDFTIELWQGEPNAKGSMYVTSFPVGLGKDDSTPNGIWAVGTKLEKPTYYSPRGEGVLPPGDPKNPLGACWISLTGTEGQAVGKKSYGIHGTIDPNSIGKQESMGCIRLKNDDALKVYEMLVDGKSTVAVRD